MFRFHGPGDEHSHRLISCIATVLLSSHRVGHATGRSRPVSHRCLCAGVELSYRIGNWRMHCAILPYRIVWENREVPIVSYRLVPDFSVSYRIVLLSSAVFGIENECSRPNYRIVSYRSMRFIVSYRVVSYSIVPSGRHWPLGALGFSWESRALLTPFGSC